MFYKLVTKYNFDIDDVSSCVMYVCMYLRYLR